MKGTLLKKKKKKKLQLGCERERVSVAQRRGQEGIARFPYGLSLLLGYCLRDNKLSSLCLLGNECFKHVKLGLFSHGTF